MSSQPADWRRRPSRGSGGTSSQAEAEQAQREQATETDYQLSRTMFSFIEPALDSIASFGAPMVLAGIVGLVAGISLVAFVPSLRLYGYINISIGIVLIGLIALISLSSVIAAFYSRTGRYGVNSSIMLVAFTGIIVVISIISFENNSRVDVTATNQFSLAQRTRDVLNSLEDPVQVTAFFKDDQGDSLDTLVRRITVEETFRDFKSARPSKFFYEFKDPDLEPDVVRDYFGEVPTAFIEESIVVQGLGSGLIRTIEPTDRANSRLEQELVTGIMVVGGQQQKTVYFLAGHGERSVDVSTNEGYSRVREWLEAENYEVRTLRWGADDLGVTVPDGNCAPDQHQCLPEAAMLVVARPTSELPDRHALALDLYLRGLTEDPKEKGALISRREGGRLIFLGEPDTPESFRRFLGRWGVLVTEGYVRDEIRSPQGQPRTLQLQFINLLELPPQVLNQLPVSVLKALLEITSPKGNALGDTFMPGAAAIGTLEDGARIPIPLAMTSADSYLIDDVERTDPIKGPEEEADPVGPFSPVAYLQAIGPVGQAPPTRQPAESEISSMIVFGDSDFITNGSLENPRGSGVDFFLNSANYLLGDYSLVSIRPKALTFREFYLDRNQRKFVEWSSWFMLPGLLALMAGLVWWVRR
ncbi:MAG: hypothetical protein BZY88_11785 [SAR202 cluster bacterium Io17-Chloro-G9]|nr:MAG: hypothetical protein BZY88_11785 [SAR202 cluster bacterium Io17-Chloro-G9]